MSGSVIDWWILFVMIGAAGVAGPRFGFGVLFVVSIIWGLIKYGLLGPF